ncbi:hypothetical protein FB451DRAFT_1192906 [Mycena latifolia]|nr:hypothetical protein FB451DRAFT_1192906 [Mycena latifolia]
MTTMQETEGKYEGRYHDWREERNEGVESILCYAMKETGAQAGGRIRTLRRDPQRPHERVEGPESEREAKAEGPDREHDPPVEEHQELRQKEDAAGREDEEDTDAVCSPSPSKIGSSLPAQRRVRLGIPPGADVYTEAGAGVDTGGGADNGKDKDHAVLCCDPRLEGRQATVQRLDFRGRIRALRRGRGRRVGVCVDERMQGARACGDTRYEPPQWAEGGKERKEGREEPGERRWQRLRLRAAGWGGGGEERAEEEHAERRRSEAQEEEELERAERGRGPRGGMRRWRESAAPLRQGKKGGTGARRGRGTRAPISIIG